MLCRTVMALALVMTDHDWRMTIRTRLRHQAANPQCSRIAKKCEKNAQSPLLAALCHSMMMPSRSRGMQTTVHHQRAEVCDSDGEKEGGRERLAHFDGSGGGGDNSTVHKRHSLCAYRSKMIRLRRKKLKMNTFAF